MSYYAVIRRRGRSWDASLPMQQQESWTQHAAFMNTLVTAGFVLLGGPLGDGLEILLIVDAGSEEEIRGRLADDPWTRGLLEIARVERWEIRLGRPGGRL